jgi:hypothetical protein
MNYKAKIMTLMTIGALYLGGCANKPVITPNHVKFKEGNTQYDLYPCGIKDTNYAILNVRGITPGRSLTFKDAGKDSTFNSIDDEIDESINGSVSKYVPGTSYTDPDGNVFRLSGNSLERTVAEEKLKKISRFEKEYKQSLKKIYDYVRNIK